MCCDLVQVVSVFFLLLQVCQFFKKVCICLFFQIGVGFDEVLVQFEGFVRFFFVIVFLLLYSNDSNDLIGLLKWFDGFVVGVDFVFEEYWGDIGDVD